MRLNSILKSSVFGGLLFSLTACHAFANNPLRNSETTGQYVKAWAGEMPKVVSLGESTDITLRYDEDSNFLGLGAVKINGVTVRNGNLPLSLRTLSQTAATDNEAFTTRVIGIERDAKNDDIVIQTRVRFANEDQGYELDWRLRPQNWPVAGKLAVGFSYCFEYRSNNRPIHRIVENGSWSLGGNVAGLRYLDQGTGYGRGSSEVLLDDRTEIKPSSPLPQKETPESRQAVGDYLDFLCSSEQSLARFVSEPSLTFRNVHRRPNEKEISIDEQYATPLTKVFRTPRTVVLLYPQGGINAWFALRDVVRRHLRKKAGIYPSKPSPWIGLDSFDLEHWPSLEQVPLLLDFYKRMGFKRLWEWSPWQTNWSEWDTMSKMDQELGRKPISHSVLKLELASKFKPNELKKLCRGASARGMKVILWFPTAHLSPASPLLKDHPEWILRCRDNTPYHYAYDEIVGVFLPAGYGKYAIDRVRILKKQLGFGGLFFDSAEVFGYDAIQYGESNWPLQWPAMLEFTRQLNQEKLDVMAECVTPFALSASTGILEKRDEGPEYLLYKTSPHGAGAKSIDPQRYFRCIAYMAPYLLPDSVWLRDKQLQELGGYVNRAYNERVSQMDDCIKLPGTQGTLWWDTSKKSGTVFAFSTGWVDIGRRIVAAEEVEGKAPVRINGNRMWVEAYRVYSLRS
jgi:hypothetical protein